MSIVSATTTNSTGSGLVAVRGGTRIFYKDWGAGQPVVFRHGWPLNADAWDDQLHLVAANGLRAVAHDRRADDLPAMLAFLSA